MERLIASVAPHICVACGSEGAVLCDWCLVDYVVPVPARCYNCMVYSADGKVCVACRRKSRIGHVWVRTDYDAAAKALIYVYKFGRKQAAAGPVARLMGQALPFIRPGTIVTHVPTASRRVRQRGYDHAQLVAQELAAQLALPYRPLLRRVTQTRQVGAKRSVRLEQMKHAFVCVGTRVPKTKVLLVDDLVTTGATLEAAAAQLRSAGAQRVDAVVFAQKR
ncbi:MAG TPA: phosphoribosyltransferase family protein [Verrucomicrobiae bacterium]|nr:phosphoribosyltransferase family protein [Verrucomicrobiae bacterium]